MAHNSSNRSKRHLENVDLAASGSWSSIFEVEGVRYGRIGRSVFRAPASSTVTQVDLLVFRADVDASGSPVDASGTAITDPDTVPYEDRVFYRTAITVAGNAVTADDDYNLLANGVEGALFDVADDSRLFAAVKSTAGTAQAGAKWALYFIGAN